MRKLIRTCEILIVLLFLAKIVVVGGVMQDSETTDFLLSVNSASADSSAVAAPATPAKDVFEDGLPEERKLLSSLLGKQKELDEREDFLQSEEKRLHALKGEILSKIDRLQEIEKRVTALLEEADRMHAEKYRSMAKVYEAAPPDRAGSMLEKLDSRTAATIIMNMKSKSAGAVLGYIKPDKSVEITREITRERAKTTAKPR